jgi:hypothetical protein
LYSTYAALFRFRRCVFAGNEAKGDGGGMYISSLSIASFESCLFAGNRAARGAAVASRLATRGHMDLINCTLSSNVALSGTGGALFARAHSSCDLRNCILWDNGLTEIDILNDSEPDGVQLSVASSCIAGDKPFPGAGNINDDPRFELPGVFNFSAYQTIQALAFETAVVPDFIVELGSYALLADSPCIDRGGGVEPGAGPSRDFAGRPRVCGAAVDMGAFESCGALPRFTRGDCDGDGAVAGRVSDAVSILVHIFIGGFEPPCKAACDANADGKLLGVLDAVHLLTALFLGGIEVPPPFPGCGESGAATDAALGCERPAAECG